MKINQFHTTREGPKISFICIEGFLLDKGKVGFIIANLPMGI